MTDLVLDVETTGLPRRRGASWRDINNWPRIVQIAWIVMEGGRESICRSAIIRPESFVIPPQAGRVHGITTAHVRAEGRPWRDRCWTMPPAIGCGALWRITSISTVRSFLPNCIARSFP